MHRYWQPIVRPLCLALEPRVIVEVGAGSGLGTENLLGYAREAQVEVHVVDPAPVERVRALCAQAPRATLHVALSEEVLEELAGDVFLVDGDHNWYTVRGDLVAIEAGARRAGRPMPVVFLHDVAWPYARRDMYYAAERVPAEFRQPYAQRGMRPGLAELQHAGGFNPMHDNALREGGPRNGILTALEDFLSESSVGWRTRLLPVFHGMAVLYVPEDLPERVRDEVERLLDVSHSALALLERVEEERVLLTMELAEIHRLLGGRPGRRVAAVVRALRRGARLLRRSRREASGATAAQEAFHPSPERSGVAPSRARHA